MKIIYFCCVKFYLKNIMSTFVVVGLQWGDEGKGKIIDVLSSNFDYIVRYQGGNNAGHTVYVQNQKKTLHLLPSGVLYCHSKCFIANGVVVDPNALIQEINILESEGLTTHHVFISHRAHIIMPYHILLDIYREEDLYEFTIGTTKKGIGPCYEDKIARIGIQAIDLLNIEVLKEKIKKNLRIKNALFKNVFIKPTIEYETILDDYIKFGKILKNRIIDTELEINTAINLGKNILFEGAQALMLDIDFGMYPYVTSSSPTTGGVCIGAGVAPNKLQYLIGISKAYSTRVGNGPYPTELFDEIGEKIRNIGNEFGTTTGRPRRCGWLDLVALKYAITINGITHLVITKLDVLSSFKTLKIAIAYKNLDGNIMHYFSSSISEIKSCSPIYKELPGWNYDISNISKFEKLPINAKKYIEFVENYLSMSICWISVGPKRSQNIIRNNFFNL